MVVTPFGMVTEVRAEQLPNEPTPIEVTLPPMVTEVRVEQ
jgi:hypothetical protein